MRGERVDARVPVWVDGTRATVPSRTLIGLRGPAGDHRLLVEVGAGGAVRLLDVDLARPEAITRSRASRRSRPSRTAGRVGRIASLVVVGLVAALGSALALGFLSASVVQSGSMEPAFRAGDLWVGVSSDLRAPGVGDVVLFTARRLDGTPVAPFTHRITSGNATDGFHTKGDANDQADPWVVPASDIHAVQVAAIPFGGLIVSLRPVLIALLAIALGFMLRARED